MSWSATRQLGVVALIEPLLPISGKVRSCCSALCRYCSGNLGKACCAVVPVSCGLPFHPLSCAFLMTEPRDTPPFLGGIVSTICSTSSSPRYLPSCDVLVTSPRDHRQAMS